MGAETAVLSERSSTTSKVEADGTSTASASQTDSNAQSRGSTLWSPKFTGTTNSLFFLTYSALKCAGARKTKSAAVLSCARRRPTSQVPTHKGNFIFLQMCLAICTKNSTTDFGTAKPCPIASPSKAFNRQVPAFKSTLAAAPEPGFAFPRGFFPSRPGCNHSGIKQPKASCTSTTCIAGNSGNSGLPCKNRFPTSTAQAKRSSRKTPSSSRAYVRAAASMSCGKSGADSDHKYVSLSGHPPAAIRWFLFSAATSRNDFNNSSAI